MTGLSIPFFGLKKQYHNLRQEILDVTDQVLRSGQVMNGNWTAEFEHWLAKTNGVKHAITCHSGTQALEIIASFYYQVLEMQRPRVLIPALTYPATATAFARAGWDIQFVDVDSYGVMTYSRMPELLEYNAICLVGLYGADVARYWRGYDLDSMITIEDAAQHWISAGFARLGVSAISFDPTKNLGNFGNGGAVLTDYSDIAEWARNWRDNSKTSEWSLTAESTNSRMSEVDCAQMMVKTQHLVSWQQRREQIARYWLERLRDTGIRCLIDKSNVDSHCFHKFVIECDNRDRVQKQMTVRRVETRVHYEKPLHEMPMFERFSGPGFLTSSSALSRRVLSLPIYPELTDLEVEYIIDQLLDSCAEERN